MQDMYKIEKKTKFFLLFFTIITTLFVFTDNQFDHVESGVYYSYTKSITEDYDLNVVNQLLKLNDVEASLYTKAKGGEGTLITSTDNSPAFWAHGGVIFWSPFFLYGKLLNKIHGRQLSYYFQFQHLALVLSTILAGLACIFFTFKLQKLMFGKIIVLPIVTSIFATPFFYYWLFEPGNGNMLPSFLAPLMIYTYWKIYTDHDDSFKSWFLLGIFSMCSAIIKLDIVFHLILFSHLFIMVFLKKRSRDSLKNYFPLILGLSIPIIFQLINDYLKFDTLSLGHTGNINRNYSVLFDALFSPYRGHVYTSPIFLIIPAAVMTLLYGIKNKISEKNIFLILLFLVPIIKEIIATSTYCHGSGNFGARQYCTEFALLTLAISYFYNKTKRLILFLSLIAISWSFIMAFLYIGDAQGYFNSLTYSINFSDHIDLFLSNLSFLPDFSLYIFSKFNNIPNKIINFLPILVAFAFIFNFLYLQSEKYSIQTITKNLAIYMITSYFVVTSLNLIFNQSNATKMRKAGFLSNSIQGNGQSIFYYEENIVSIEERMMLEKARGNNKIFNNLLVIRKSYHEQSIKELLTKGHYDLRQYFPFPELGYDDQFLREFKKFNIPILNSYSK